MTEIDQKVEAVKQWLEHQFPEARVETREIFASETQLFRVQTAKGRSPELEISREVLEDQSSETIVRELAKGDTLERMRRDPSVRIQYFSICCQSFRDALCAMR